LETDEVTPDELVFRRILNRTDYCLPEPSSRRVSLVAFRPTDDDDTGISIYRQACGVEPSQVAMGPFSGGYYVAAIAVADITGLDIEGLRPTVIPSPSAGLKGHASIPELNVTLRDGSKRQYRLLAQRLADLASDGIVHDPNVFRAEAG